MFVRRSQWEHIHVVDLKDGVMNWIYGEQVYKNNLVKKCTTYKQKIVRYFQRRLNSYANIVKWFHNKISSIESLVAVKSV